MSLPSVTPVEGIDLPNEEIDLFSPEGSYSLFRLLNGCKATQRALQEIPANLFELTENELLKSPDDVQRRLKISFWNEFRRAQRQNQPLMILSNVIFGVCSYAYWNDKVCGDPRLLAWIVTPPTSEILVWQELLELGHKKLRRVMKLPLVEKRYWKDKSGEVHVEKRTNVSLVKEIRAIVETLQDRLHGTVIQRQEIQSKSLNVNLGTKADVSVTKDMDDIKELIARIEKVAKTMPELPEAVILEGEIPEDPE